MYTVVNWATTANTRVHTAITTRLVELLEAPFGFYRVGQKKISLLIVVNFV